eukprot:6185527-Pleurochrysis_carterae.AAC.2
MRQPGMQLHCATGRRTERPSLMSKPTSAGTQSMPSFLATCRNGFGEKLLFKRPCDLRYLGDRIKAGQKSGACVVASEREDKKCGG